MARVNAKTGEELSDLWLIPLVPVFLVGLFFYAVSGLTCMAFAVSILDSSPALSAGPVSTQLDWVFVIEVLRFDRWLVGLAGLSIPWLAVIPGFVAAAIREWATGGLTRGA